MLHKVRCSAFFSRAEKTVRFEQGLTCMRHKEAHITKIQDFLSYSLIIQKKIRKAKIAFPAFCPERACSLCRINAMTAPKGTFGDMFEGKHYP